jgi:hypothetical protein
MVWEKWPARASRRQEEANTWSCTELFPSPCARQERRSSAGMVSLLERYSAGIELLLGAALRAGTGLLRRVAEDAFVAAAREAPSLHKDELSQIGLETGFTPDG